MAEVLLFHDTEMSECPCTAGLDEGDFEDEDTPLDFAMRRMDNHIMSNLREGGTDMARHCTRFKNVRDRRTGRTRRVCTSYSGSRGFSGVGTLAPLGQTTSLRANFNSIQSLLVTGGIAAGGAVITQKVFDMIATKITLTGVKRYVAEMATGIAIGIVVGKVFKKPKLGANIAIGPIVLGALKIFGELMHTGPMAPYSGLGLQTIQPYTPQNPYSGLGYQQIGTNVPAWMMEPQVDPTAMAGSQISY